MLYQTNLQELLPSNLISRPMTLDDAEQFVKLYDAESAYLGYKDKWNVDVILSDWQEPDFHLETSTQGIFSADGTLIAYALIWDNHEVPVHPYVQWTVHPDYFHLSLEGPLLQWLLATTQRVLSRVPADARVSLRTISNRLHKFHQENTENVGFVPLRYSYRMRIDMNSAPDVPASPEGINLRTYRHPEELREVAEMIDAGFSDHFGHVKQDIKNVVAYWEHETSNDKLFDPSLYFLAIDDTTGKIVGGCIARIEGWTDPETALVIDLAVLREYRKRGIAYALLLHCFGEFWKRGRKSVVLGVDASSLTGAVRLYERAGMYIQRQYSWYEKVLREGIEIETTSV